jgi:O-antigen/teichoic acid export membrane protein
VLGDSSGHGWRARVAAAWPHWRVLGGELLSSYALFAVMALSALLLAPWYARFLGAAEWGVAALALTIHGLLFTLEQMLGPLLLRDIGGADGERRPALLRRHRRRYQRGGLLLSLLAAPALWLGEAAPALWLTLPMFLLQISNSVEVGYWHASGSLHRANRRSAGFHLLKHGLAVGGLLFLAPRAELLVGGLLLGSALEYVANRRAHAVDGVGAAAASTDAPLVQREAGLALFGLASLCGLLSGQVDRLVLSWALPLTDYGRYYLLGSVLLAVLHLQLPLQRSFLPRIAAAAEPWPIALAMLRAGLLFIGLPCLGAIVLAEPALRIWSGDPILASEGAPVLRGMLLAAILMVVYAPLGSVLLSRTRYRHLLAINAGVLGVQLLTLLLCVDALGMLAGALAWLAAAGLQLAVLLRGWRREAWLR